MSQKTKYLEEYEKYRDVVITPGLYKIKNNKLIQVEVLEYSLDKVKIKNTLSGFVSEKTSHWARKNLEAI